MTASCFVFRGTSLLVATQGGQYALPDEALLPALGPPLRRCPLGTLDARPCVSLEVRLETPAPTGHEFVGLRSLFGKVDAPLLTLAGRALQIIDWDRTHQFCSQCGHATILSNDERAKICPACHHAAYPRIAPVVMGLVVREQELLLARSAHFAPGVYSALAGFCEAGEDLETALRREIREEVALEVRDIRYFQSQSWPFPHSLMVAFTCHYLAGEVVPQPGEIEDARWFPMHALPALPHPVSIARQLIDATVTRLRTKSHVTH